MCHLAARDSQIARVTCTGPLYATNRYQFLTAVAQYWACIGAPVTVFPWRRNSKPQMWLLRHRDRQARTRTTFKIYILH